jgi:hypothetical protein
VLDQVRTDFQGVFNRGFRDGWKSALKKAKVPSSLKWFLRDETPLLYPDAGLMNSDAKDEDDEDDEDKTEEVSGEQGTGPSAPIPEDSSAPPEDVADPSASAPIDLAVSDPPATYGPAPVDPAPPSEN